MSLRSIAIGLAVIAVLGSSAWAAGTIASIVGNDGVIHGCYAQRNGTLRVVAEGTTCGRGELGIEWSQQGPAGAQGPQGVPGEPGAALSSVEQLACDTGSVARPDARIDMTVAADTGAISLTCRSTNPVLALASGLVSSPPGCFPGTAGCSFERYAVDIEVDGVAVVDGVECNAAFGLVCTTQRFPLGTTVHLTAAGDLAGYEPLWSGCDSVEGRTCTVVMTEDRSATVTPTAI